MESVSAIVYSTSLRREECLRRLQRHSARPGWKPQPKGTIYAKIRGDRFRLFATGPAYTHNSFAPFFYGRLEEETNGTKIRGSFRMHWYVQGFLMVWFGGLAVMSGVVLFLILFRPNSAWEHGRSPPVWMAAGPVGMMALGAGLVLFCRWLARGQRENLRSFLSEELEAQLNDRI